MFFDHRACILVVSQTSKLCMAQMVDSIKLMRKPRLFQPSITAHETRDAGCGEETQ
jgi:hypothetical protein